MYIVSCVDGSLYCGITKDVDSRIKAHNKGTGAVYTRTRRPVTLVWTESKEDKGSALRREAEIKKLTRSQKKLLIKNKQTETFL